MGRSSMLTRSETLGLSGLSCRTSWRTPGRRLSSRTDRVDGEWNTVHPLGLLQPLDLTCAVRPQLPDLLADAGAALVVEDAGLPGGARGPGGGRYFEYRPGGR